MKKFFASKKFLFLLSALALIVAGLFIYFYLFPSNSSLISKIIEGEFPTGVESDKIPPATAILSPSDKYWLSSDFEVEIMDSDLGSGLSDYIQGKAGCKYIIEDLGTGIALSNFRECGLAKITVPVGENKTCSSSYQKNDHSQGKCRVSVKAYDKAGNDSGWEDHIFNIDLILPKVGEITVNEGENILDLNKNYNIKAVVSDNSRITGCWLYIDNKIQDKKITIDPLPCKDEGECNISTSISFDKEREYGLKFGCSDAARNLSYGKEVKIKATTNHSPEISSCRAAPSKGSIQTEFKFQTEAIDPDGNSIFYLWDFGDNQTSSDSSPSHYYSAEGTFKPKIVVADGLGGMDECSTAWVVVGQ